MDRQSHVAKRCPARWHVHVPIENGAIDICLLIPRGGPNCQPGRAYQNGLIEGRPASGMVNRANPSPAAAWD